MMDLKKWRASRPSAKAWDKVEAQESAESATNRDVHETQQMERSQRRERRSKTPAHIAGLVVALLVAAGVWLAYSFLTLSIANVASMMQEGLSDSSSPTSSESASYYTQDTTPGPQVPAGEKCFLPLTEKGWADHKNGCYSSAEDVPVPAWWDGPTAAQEAKDAKDASVQPGAASTSGASSDGPAAADGRQADSGADSETLGDHVSSFSWLKLMVALLGGFLVGSLVHRWLSKQVDRLNTMYDTSDINQHQGDQYIALPEEIQRKFNWFPDAGAHSEVEANSMISHMMLSKKGLKKVAVTQRAEKDIVDPRSGELIYHAGEPLLDDDGAPRTAMHPIIDEAFGTELFEASEVPDEPSARRRYDATKIPYNADGKDREKVGSYKSVAELINTDWEFPDYEVQRPAGAYLVDSGPVNTMLLAMTRAGKGQTYIEPMIDMWSREKKPSNMVINDPKGELLMKNYVSLVTRGFEPVQFNLINEMKTDIYNLLGMAAEAAREGDATKAATHVETVADVFFPLDGGEDPVWPNAANNAFRRAAYGLIDFYLEEERELRAAAALRGTDPEVLDRKLDDMWGKVTLYNCYQFFVQLTSKKVKNPMARVEADAKAGVYDDDEDGLTQAQEDAQSKMFLWEGQDEMDMLSLYFNATAALPTNTSRTLVGNAHNALKAMAGAEKMLASVYGIAITAMSFFTKPTIATLTSGKPSQAVDLGSLSFPRRMGVRFTQDFVARNNLVGLAVLWSAYADEMFTQNLGPTFEHSDIVSRDGWARYYFEGIFPQDVAYLKLELSNPQTKMLVRTYYFHFKKGYQVSGNGRHFVTEEVTGKKIVKNGLLRELRPVREGGTQDGKILSFRREESTYSSTKLVRNEHQLLEQVPASFPVIMQTSVRYGELPKAVFFITPPHLLAYAKLILVVLKQLVDLNFDKSYMTKSNQKPLYRTRFMLDELGNLQSEGQGIAGFSTMLSIGLGQSQQFTIVLQTLQQLRDVYGDSIDRIISSNTSNIIFLKSSDDSMIETLEKMSGTTHRSYINSKQVTQDLDKMVGGATDARVSYTMSTEKEPVISYTNLASLPMRNSIVFRAGDNPVWNRRQTALPMSFKLLENTIKHPGHDNYTLQTIPTLSTAMSFNVRRNQPDFVKMLDKRMKQAIYAVRAKADYMSAYDYKEVDIERLDPDTYANEVMTLVSEAIAGEETIDPAAAMMVDPADYDSAQVLDEQDFIDNVEVTQDVARRAADKAEREALIYAEGQISREMLVNPNGSARVKALDVQIAEAYRSARVEMESDTEYFSVVGDNLCSVDGSQVYISNTHSASYARALSELNERVADEGARVFAEADLDESDMDRLATVSVHAAFYQFLASLPNWTSFARGEFDRAMAVEMRA